MNGHWINNKIKVFANNPLGYLGFEEIHNSFLWVSFYWYLRSILPGGSARVPFSI